VNYLIDLANISGDKKPDIPPQLWQKIEKFQKNGGITNYGKIRGYIEDSARNGVTLINEVKTTLAKEKDEDDVCRMQYPKEWNRPISEQINNEYVFQLKDLEQKYMVAQNMDQQVLKKYDQTLEWMKKFSQPKDVIVSLIPKSSDIEFIQKNKQGISELSDLNKKLESIISLEKNREIMKTLSENINKLNYVQSLLAINNKQAEKDKEFDKMLEPLRQ